MNQIIGFLCLFTHQIIHPAIFVLVADNAVFVGKINCTGYSVGIIFGDSVSIVIYFIMMTYINSRICSTIKSIIASNIIWIENWVVIINK